MTKFYNKNTHRISRGTQHIEGKITDLLKPLFDSDKKNFLIINNITKNWEKIVGKKYSKLCEPMSVSFARKKDGEKTQAKLTISVYSSAVGFFLQNNSETLIERIAALYGYKAVNKIVVKQDLREVFLDKKEDIILSQEDENDLQESLKGVKDRDLAATLARLGRDVIGRK